MIDRKLRPLAGAIVLMLSLANVGSAQENAPAQPTRATTPVTVGVYVNPPFVIQDGEQYSGLAFELFENVARRGNLTPSYQSFATPAELLRATLEGDIDVAIGNLTVTRERLSEVDFSFPWHDGGLRIMIDGKSKVDLSNLWRELGDAGHLRAFFWLGFFILAATILLTLFDRKFDKEFPRSWFSGTIDSFYHVISITTSGRTSRKMMFGAYGKLVAAFWLVFGVAVLAYVTSSVTSVMTAAAVTNDIKGVSDLRDRMVGVLRGGASELYARKIGLSVRSFASLEEAEEALIGGEIEAIIGDSTVLEYSLHHSDKAGLEVVGPLFDPEKYAFATANGSPLTRLISLDLLASHEDGTMAILRAKYLGSDH